MIRFAVGAERALMGDGRTSRDVKSKVWGLGSKVRGAYKGT